MRTSRSLLGLTLALALALAGCGTATGTGTGRSTRAGGSGALPAEAQATPRAIAKSCSALAHSKALPVRCPARLPPGRWHPEPRLGLRLQRCAYLLSIVTNERTSPFHIIFGGQCTSFPLSVRAGRWPGLPAFRDELGLVGGKTLKPGQHRFQPVFPSVIRRVALGQHPGLLLQIAPFPDGGVHGGHIAVVWDQQGHGYALSMHFSEQPSAATPAEEQEVLEAAASMSASGPGR